MSLPRVAFLVAFAVLMAWLVVWAATTAHAEPQQEYVRLTFYLPTGSPMRDGEWPYVGAAACGSYFPMGTVLELPDGFMVTCADTGWLAPAQVDIFSPSMAWGRTNVEAAYGTYTWIGVNRWGWE